MKKLLLAVAAFVGMAISANAQLGISAGLTSASATLEAAAQDVTGGSINQYHVGLTYKIGIGNILAIQPSILYNVKGSSFDATNITNTKLDFKTGFVEVPVQLQLGLGIGNFIRVYGLAEPFVGYAITNEVSLKGALASAAEPEKTWDNVKNRLEYGVSLGAGVELLRHLQVSVKYFWTLSDLYGLQDAKLDNIMQSLGNINAKNVNGIAATVTVLF